ncbi:MAG TPA: hypothetical protein VK465_00560 [Fibrobacteria bacterium]|nr:hypothetical protein [Fibrobacteria bacterium]
MDLYTTCNYCGIDSICSARINKVKKTPSSPSVDYSRTAEKGSGGGLYQSSGSRGNGVVKLSQVVQ